MTKTDHGIFQFIDPPSETALQQCVEAINNCFYPFELCLPELEQESNGKVTVLWGETPNGTTGEYHRSLNGQANVIVLNRYRTLNYSFVFLHECGHMVDDTALTNEQKKALVDKWHRDNDDPWPSYYPQSHNTPHEHTGTTGWGVKNVEYHLRATEAFADAFVACFAPSYFMIRRFAHWSEDYAGLRDIILPKLPPPVVSEFPNDSVYRLYRAVFLREPDRAGYEHWLQKLQGGMSIKTIADLFCSSTEFRNRYGSLNNTQFVTLLYRNVLEREPDAGGLNYWTNLLIQGAGRGFVVVGFSDSTEFKNKITDERA